MAWDTRKRSDRPLDIDVNSIMNENPYLQAPTLAQPGCQIDFMIQTKFSSLYVCEIRFSTRPIGTEIIKEVQRKIDRSIASSARSTCP